MDLFDVILLKTGGRVPEMTFPVSMISKSGKNISFMFDDFC